MGFVIELPKHLSMSSLTRVPYFPVTWPFWGLGLALWAFPHCGRNQRLEADYNFGRVREHLHHNDGRGMVIQKWVGCILPVIR